ncbi:hypothetical protein [Mesorhizobium sp. M1329]|uniref:hypothetical protein n=1 Tax=Mesorhizobium sp. M1329 TaxID=2957083 RepID=UPI00333D2C7B
MATSALPSSGGDVSAIPAALAISENFYAALFLPVTIRGEMPGRAMRGGVNA